MPHQLRFCRSVSVATLGSLKRGIAEPVSVAQHRLGASNNPPCHADGARCWLRWRPWPRFWRGLAGGWCPVELYRTGWIGYVGAALRSNQTSRRMLDARLATVIRAVTCTRPMLPRRDQPRRMKGAAGMALAFHRFADGYRGRSKAMRRSNSVEGARLFDPPWD